MKTKPFFIPYRRRERRPQCRLGSGIARARRQAGPPAAEADVPSAVQNGAGNAGVSAGPEAELLTPGVKQNPGEAGTPRLDKTTERLGTLAPLPAVEAELHASGVKRDLWRRSAATAGVPPAVHGGADVAASGPKKLNNSEGSGAKTKKPG